MHNSSKTLLVVGLITALGLGLGLNCLAGSYSYSVERVKDDRVEFEISRGKTPILLVSQQVLVEPDLLVHLGIWVEGFGNEYIFGVAKWTGTRPYLWLGSASFLAKTQDGHPINHNTSRSNNSDKIIYNPNEDEPGDTLGNLTGMVPLLQKLGGILLELDKDQIYSGIPNSTGVSQQSIIQSKNDRLPPRRVDI